MLIKCLPVGHLMTNCYIVTDETTLECARHRPGRRVQHHPLLSGGQPPHLPRHPAHARALRPHRRRLCRARGDRRARIHERARRGHGRRVRQLLVRPAEGTIFYKEGDEVKVGNLTFRVMETPGHTPGGVTLICGDALFTGDTLFAGSCGRTDFAGGSMEVELQSLAKDRRPCPAITRSTPATWTAPRSRPSAASTPT